MKVIPELVQALNEMGRLSEADLDWLLEEGYCDEAIAFAGRARSSEARVDAGAEEAARAEAAIDWRLVETVEARLEAPRPGARRTSRKPGAAERRRNRLCDLNARLAAARARDPAIDGLRRLARAGGFGGDALGALAKASDPALEAAMGRLILSERRGLGWATALIVCDYPRPSRAQVRQGGAFRAYGALLDLGRQGPASRFGWALRSVEVARAYQLVRLQERLAAALGRLILAEPPRFNRPVRPFDPGAYLLLCAILTVHLQGRSQRVRGQEYPGLRRARTMRPPGFERFGWVLRMARASDPSRFDAMMAAEGGWAIPEVLLDALRRERMATRSAFEDRGHRAVAALWTMDRWSAACPQQAA